MPPKEIKPWSIKQPTVEDAQQVDLNKAKEITPFGLYASLDLFVNAPQQQNLVDFRARAQQNVSPEIPKVAEAKASAEADPKAAASSVVDSASSSVTDTSESGTPPTDQTQILIHPSMLPENSVDPASAEKDLNLRPPLFS